MRWKLCESSAAWQCTPLTPPQGRAKKSAPLRLCKRHITLATRRRAKARDRVPNARLTIHSVAVRPREEVGGSTPFEPQPQVGRGGPGPSRRLLRYEAPGALWYFLASEKVRPPGRCCLNYATIKSSRTNSLSQACACQLPRGGSLSKRAITDRPYT